MTDLSSSKRGRGRPRSAFAEAGPIIVQALDRGLTVLRALAHKEHATLSDLALAADMPASTVHRVLSTLQVHGFVELDETTQAWQIGVGAYHVGSVFLRRTNIVEAARGPMRTLMRATGETANLGLPDGDEVVFVAQVESHAPIRAFFRPGTRSAVHASGIGKALLSVRPRPEIEALVRRTGLTSFTATTLCTPVRLFADLEQTVARGWSFDNQERHDGMSCIASVIYDTFGTPVAGVSVSGPASRFGPSEIEAIGSQVKETARIITRTIGGAPAQQ